MTQPQSSESPTELFRRAAELIDRALCQLDLREETRAPGEPRRYHNFEHYKIHQRVYLVPGKLRRAAAAWADWIMSTSPGSPL